MYLLTCSEYVLLHIYVSFQALIKRPADMSEAFEKLMMQGNDNQSDMATSLEAGGPDVNNPDQSTVLENQSDLATSLENQSSLVENVPEIETRLEDDKTTLENQSDIASSLGNQS